jgi:hypothetical protein
MLTQIKSLGQVAQQVNEQFDKLPDGTLRHLLFARVIKQGAPALGKAFRGETISYREATAIAGMLAHSARMLTETRSSVPKPHKISLESAMDSFINSFVSQSDNSNRG